MTMLLQEPYNVRVAGSNPTVVARSPRLTVVLSDPTVPEVFSGNCRRHPPRAIDTVRLIVTAVSVSANPGGALLSASVCALQVFAPPASTSIASGAGVTLATGMLGLGTAAPMQRLDVRGSALVSGALGIGGVTAPQYLLHLQRDSAAKPSSSTWTVFSDRRLKEDVQECDLRRCVEIVKAVPMSRFMWRDDVHSPDDVPDRSKLGFVAQDVQRVFPKAVVPQAAHGLEDCLSLNTDHDDGALRRGPRHPAGRRCEGRDVGHSAE